jgi:hypothetical protein
MPHDLQKSYQMTKASRRDQSRAQFRERMLLAGQQGQPLIAAQLGSNP